MAGHNRARAPPRRPAINRGAWTDAEHERLSATNKVDAVRADEPAPDASPGRFRRTRAIAVRTICWHSPTRKIHALFAAVGELFARRSGRDHAHAAMAAKAAENAAEAEARRMLSPPVPVGESRSLEPVFGQIKQARGFRQFLLRGIEGQCRLSEWR